MKKRGQKLSLHRETILHLERLPEKKLGKAAGGFVTSCTYPCECGDCPGPNPEQFQPYQLGE